MNATIIANWNQRVQADDQVYLLGDVAMVPNKPSAFAEVAAVLEQLNGQLIIIKGNHDNRAFLKYLAKHDAGLSAGKAHYQFADVGELIKINHHQYFLTHYPLLLGKVQQTFNLHGHIHHYMCRLQRISMSGLMHQSANYYLNGCRLEHPLRQMRLKSFLNANKPRWQTPATTS